MRLDSLKESITKAADKLIEDVRERVKANIDPLKHVRGQVAEIERKIEEKGKFGRTKNTSK